MPGHFSVVGTGRCGSSWLANVLRPHPGLAWTHEARVVEFLYFSAQLASLPQFEESRIPPLDEYPVRGIVENSVQRVFSPIFAEHSLEICLAFYRRQFAHKPDFAWWGDKLLDIRAALVLQDLVPEARFLALVRDPRDVLCSWRAFGAKMGTKGQQTMAGIEPAVHARWWNTLYGEGIHRLGHTVTMRYEDMVRDPEPSVRRVLDHVDLEWLPEIAEHIESRDLFDRHGTARSPTDSIGRWRDQLDRDELVTIETACGATMRRFGYELATDEGRAAADGAGSAGSTDGAGPDGG